jgi:putative transport protein
MADFAMSDVGLVIVALAAAGALGHGIGALKVGGVSIGIGGVLFAGILVGHLARDAGVAFDPHVLEFVREFGLILFVFSIGIQVGPGFFASLRRAGATLNLLAAAVVALGVATTLALHALTGIDVAALVGVMSGAVTNTPGLGAATQALKDAGADAATLARPGLGYAMAYPFGILGALLAMIGLRMAFAPDLGAEARAFDAASARPGPALPSMNVAIRNPNLVGLTLGETPRLFDADVAASRMLKDGALVVPTRATPMGLGDVLHLVGPLDKLREMALLLGEPVDTPLSTRGTALTWERIVVTETRALGRTLGALDLEATHGVRVSRLSRAGAELVARGDLALQFGDVATVVGPQEGIDAVRAALGDEAKRLQEARFDAMFVGIALGVLLGSVPVALPGLPAPVKLGLAGGPLVAAILLARLGRLGPLVWFMPPTANQALRELGIALFLAVVGIRAGDGFVETLTGGEGLRWAAMGAAITLIPLATVGVFARVVLKMNHLTLCGALAGAMTDPPALAFANAQAPSPAPALAYAAVYPLAMCLRILAPQALVLALG